MRSNTHQLLLLRPQVHQAPGGRQQPAGLDCVGRGQLLHSGRFPGAGRRLQDAGEAAPGFGFLPQTCH